MTRLPVSLDDPGWAGLHHAYGPATDMKRMWARLIDRGDPDGEIGNMLCHQGELSVVAMALTPFLVEHALTGKRGRAAVIRLLAGFVGARTTLLQATQQRAASRKVVRFRNPRTGEIVEGVLTDRAPPIEAVETERVLFAVTRNAIAACAAALCAEEHDSSRRSDPDFDIAVSDLCASCRETGLFENGQNEPGSRKVVR